MVSASAMKGLISQYEYSVTFRVISHFVLYDTYSEPYLLLKIQTYSGIFTSCSDIFSHIVTCLEPFVILSCICKTLPYSESWHIQNSRYIQNSVKTYSGIFSRLCNTRILKNLLYSELCHIQNFGIEKLEAYSDSCLFRHIQAYSNIFNNDNINFFLHFFHAFQQDFKRNICFLTKMTSISILYYLNNTRL